MRKKLLWIFFITLLIFSIPTVNMIGVTVAQPVRDIAVTGITLTRVATGELVNVTVVVKNNGTVNEPFNVTLYYDSTSIETQNVTDLPSGANKTLLFVWNTTSVSAGTYSIKAVASQVDDENVENNIITAPITEEQVEIKSTYIAVVPQSTVDTNLTPGKNYTISIYTDYNGTDVWGYEFALTYNPLVLEGVEVINGDLITTDKDPSATFQPGDFNNTLGKLSLTSAFFFFLDPPAPETSGPGILANVTFTVVGMGDSDITLVESEGGKVITKLRNSKSGLEGIIINEFIPDWDHILHGYFRNTAELVTHDIAVLSVTPSNTSVVEGEFVNVTVVVKNNGTVAETFDVEVWYDYEPLLGTPIFQRIGKIEEYLVAGANTSLTFTWDTTDVPAGNHTITAVASTVPGEIDTADNTLTSDETVTVTAVQETPIPIEFIIIIVLVVVIAVVVYAVIRRKKSIPE